ncbi:MAG: amidohydrolase [Candidatus Electryonea clarkiae]|nr:amidohydrolase [Candidatus Electryonea clarkiae]MDP8288136.1 amidohydrolase [Candidatus Electryonea clarkiae]
MGSLLVENVILDDQKTSIYCNNGKIVSIGEDCNADEIFDGCGYIVHPALNNSHTHAAMTLFRGNGDDMPLMEWLQTRVWPYEQNISSEEVYWGTKLAITEMIRSGIVFFNDMYWDFHAVAKAVEETGIKACLSAVFIDFDDPVQAKSQQKTNERLHIEAKDYSDRITFGVGPHAIYTVSEDSLRWAGEFTREHNLKLHIHLSETEYEVKECVKTHSCSPVEYLKRTGMLSDRLAAAHTVWLSERDIGLLGDYGVLTINNPVSNMKLAVGEVYPYRKLKDAGAVTAIGTDGAGSNNNLDLFEEMKIAALLQKFKENDPTALPAGEAIEMATINPSNFFGLNNGQIKPGSAADFILIDVQRPEMQPMHNLTSHLVYSANGYAVDSVICDGRLLMKHRKIENEEEIMEGAYRAAKNLFARVDKAK